jgi:hypothetical protein
MISNACNPRTQETKARKLRVQCQSGLHSETFSKQHHHHPVCSSAHLYPSTWEVTLGISCVQGHPRQSKTQSQNRIQNKKGLGTL